MEANNVNRIILLLVFFMTSSFVFSQRTRYLLLDKTKDSILTIGKIKYYKIDNNLFNLDRFNEIDTIGAKNVDTIKFTCVNKLWENGKKLFLKVSKEKNLLIESKNEIFEEIYVLEKLQNCKYKRTRVWWIDY